MTLERRVSILEAELAATKNLLKEVLEKFRETAIIEIGLIEDRLGMKRTVPTREERNKAYQQQLHSG